MRKESTMKRSIRAAMAVSALLVSVSAMGQSMPTLCENQTPACFHFTGVLTVERNYPITVEGWSQDNPGAGFINRYHLLLSANAYAPLSIFDGPSKEWIGGAAVIWPDGWHGGMYTEALSGQCGASRWRLDIAPTNPAVAAAFYGWAGLNEHRWQFFQVTQLVGDLALITITEPVQE